MPFPGDIIRSGVKIANKLTVGVQSKVEWYAWISQDGFGGSSFADVKILSCIIDRTQRQIVTLSGQSVIIVATLTVVGDIKPNGASGRHEPIDTRDKIVLPDGFTGPIIDAPGSVVDPSTGRGFVNIIMLGAR